MNRITLIALMLTISILTFGQAKKPTIMVVPSDAWCISHGYIAGNDDTGNPIPDYQAALQGDSDMRIIVSKMGGIMADHEFPMKSLEAELKKIADDDAMLNAMAIDQNDMRFVKESAVDKLLRSAGADIIVDVDFTIKSGMKRQVAFNVQALDAYTSKIISGNTGVSSLSSSAPIETLLEESVLSYMDQFTYDLQHHFDDMFANGREIRLTLMRWDDSYVDFETLFDYNGIEAELADIIEVWMVENTIESRYSLEMRSANMLRFEQVRIPLYAKNIAGREVAIESSAWARGLASFLRRDEYGNIPVKVMPKGLGEVWLIIGGEY